MTNLFITYGDTPGVIYFGITISVILIIVGAIFAIAASWTSDQGFLFRLLMAALCVFGGIIVSSITVSLGNSISKDNIKAALEEKYEDVIFSNDCDSEEGEFEVSGKYYKYIIENKKIKVYYLGVKEEQFNEESKITDDIIEYK